MEQIRLEQLSIYYWLQSLVPDFVTIKDEYPFDELSLPTISITSGDTRARPFQLGSSELDYQDWEIYIFAQNSGQRDDYLSIIYNEAENNICVYNYNLGFPPNVSPPETGSLMVVNRVKKPLRVYEDLVKKKYWWGVVSLRTYFDPST